MIELDFVVIPMDVAARFCHWHHVSKVYRHPSGRPIAMQALTFYLVPTLSRCPFLRTFLNPPNICLRYSLNASQPPLLKTVWPTWGTRVSRVVLGLRPISSSKGDTVQGEDVSGRVRLIQHPCTTYSSQRSGHAAHSFDKTSCIQLSNLSTEPCARG